MNDTKQQNRYVDPTTNVISEYTEYIDKLCKDGLDNNNKFIIRISLIIGLSYMLISSVLLDKLISFYIENKYLRYIIINLLFVFVVIMILKINKYHS
jgi:hypothetical protein